MKELRELLDSERRAHDELINDLERKAVQEKDRLKKEMVRPLPTQGNSRAHVLIQLIGGFQNAMYH